jgi:hypothetical protein
VVPVTTPVITTSPAACGVILLPEIDATAGLEDVYVTGAAETGFCCASVTTLLSVAVSVRLIDGGLAVIMTFAGDPATAAVEIETVRPVAGMVATRKALATCAGMTQELGETRPFLSVTAVSGVTCDPPVGVKATVTLGKPRFDESNTTNTGSGDTGIPTVALAGAGVTTEMAAGPVSRGPLDEVQLAPLIEPTAIKTAPRFLFIPLHIIRRL